MPAIAEKHFRPTTQRFLKALAHCLPGISQAELAWRAHFMVGAMAHAMCNPPLLPKLGPETNLRRRMKLLVTFLAAGFRAPATQGEEK